MLTFQQSEALIFDSYNRIGSTLNGYDQHTRDLSGMARLYALANIPLDSAPALIVTGSKGKGSTSLFAAALAQGMGHHIGLMTSPHFRTVRERIRLDGRAIPESDFCRIVTALQPSIEKVSAELRPGKYLGPGGLFQAVALRYFAEQGATALVLEAGRGGRYDDVSLVTANRVVGFTPIMAEHLDKMGPTIADVVWHKGGLIQPGVRAITSPQSPDVLHRLQGIAARSNVMLQQTRRHPILTNIQLESPALYQRDNLALAYGAIRLLWPDRKIGTAWVERLHLTGRCDQLSIAPQVWLDGAINGESAALFRDSIVSRITRPLILVAALPHDKDHEGFFRELAPHVDQIIITQVSATHLQFDSNPARAARLYTPNVIEQPAVFAAFDQALNLAGTRGTLWIVGTQSLVRDALTQWDIDLETIYRA